MTQKTNTNFTVCIIALYILLCFSPLNASSLPIYRSQFGGFGTGNGQFVSPNGIAINATGKTYVTDIVNNRVQIFKNTGTVQNPVISYVSQFGTSGAGNGQFIGPYGVTFDVMANMFITDIGNNRVQIFNDTGTYLAQFGTPGTGDGQFVGAYGITSDALGHIYVTDVGNNRVQIFKNTGTYLAQFGAPGAGNGQFQKPYGITSDTLGNIYVTDVGNNRVQIFMNTGTTSNPVISYVGQFGTPGTGNGQFQKPYGITSDTHGHIYVTDTYNGRVQVFRNMGTAQNPVIAYVSQFGSAGYHANGKFVGPYGIATDPTGNIYVTDIGNRRVQIFWERAFGGTDVISTQTIHDLDLTLQNLHLNRPGEDTNTLNLIPNQTLTVSGSLKIGTGKTLALSGGTLVLMDIKTKNDAGLLNLNEGTITASGINDLSSLGTRFKNNGSATINIPTPGDSLSLPSFTVGNGATGITLSQIGSGALIVPTLTIGEGNTFKIMGGKLSGTALLTSGGTLSGVGTIDKDVINNGTLKPAIGDMQGNLSEGALTIAGNYMQTGTLIALIGNATMPVSVLDVRKNVILDATSSIIALQPTTDFNPQNTQIGAYSFLKAGGTITGFFSQGNISSLPNGLNVQIVGPRTRADGQSGQEILVILSNNGDTTKLSSITLGSEVVASTTTVLSNQINRSQEKLNASSSASDHITFNDWAGGSFRARFYIPSHRQAGSLFQSSSGERYHIPQGWESLCSIVDQSGPLDFGKDINANGKLNTSVWIAPLYTQGRNKPTPTSGPSSDSIQLLLGGMEWRNLESKHLFGVSLGGGVGETKSNTLSTNKSDHETFQSAFYHSMCWDEIRWDAFLNASKMFNHNQRIADLSTGYRVTSSNSTDVLGISTEVSYKGDLGNLLVLRPYYGIDYWYIMQHGYREKDNSIYSQSHARITAGGFDNYIGTTLRKTWMNVGVYSVRVEGDLYFSYTLKNPRLVDTISAVEGNGTICSRIIGGYDCWTLGPSLTLSAMHQATGIKYFINTSATLQNKRTSYQFLLKASMPV